MIPREQGPDRRSEAGKQREAEHAPVAAGGENRAASASPDGACRGRVLRMKLEQRTRRNPRPLELLSRPNSGEAQAQPATPRQQEFKNCFLGQTLEKSGFQQQARSCPPPQSAKNPPRQARLRRAPSPAATAAGVLRTGPRWAFRAKGRTGRSPFDLLPPHSPEPAAVFALSALYAYNISGRSHRGLSKKISRSAAGGGPRGREVAKRLGAGVVDSASTSLGAAWPQP